LRSDAIITRAAYLETGRLTRNAMHIVDAYRMVKRRLKGAGLPSRLSPDSFRVTTITDLLEQGGPLEDVQHPAGHAGSRTTRLYDRRQQRESRGISSRGFQSELGAAQSMTSLQFVQVAGHPSQLPTRSHLAR